MFSHSFKIIAITSVVYGFSGCAKAPEAELAAAKAAIKAAQDVEADKYMTKKFSERLESSRSRRSRNSKAEKLICYFP